MNIIIYEDSYTSFLEPFSINHASFELQNGLYTNIDRITEYYGNKKKYILIVREGIEDLISEKYSNFQINPDIVPKGKCFNGALVVDSVIREKISKQDYFANKDTILFF